MFFEQNTHMKLEKKDKIYIFFIVLLSALFVGLFFLTISGWFYKDNSVSNTNLTIGSSAVIEVDRSSAKVLSYNFDGAILGGEEIKQNISIKNIGDEDVFLRAKISIFSSNHVDPVIYLKTNSSWILNDDGYYYFNDSLKILNTIGLASAFIFSNEEELASKEDYILTIVVESLSVDFDKTSIWGY